MRPRQRQYYAELLRYARKVSRKGDEAEDLLQMVLLSALEAGRGDMGCTVNRRWLFGALRKRALFEARSAIRRRHREARVPDQGQHQNQHQDQASGAQADESAGFVHGLPPSLRVTALLALSGHTRAEIAWLLRLTDAALRQRIAQIRKRWRAGGDREFVGFSGPNGGLAFGRIRQALLKPARRDKVVLASHDPDGHLFVICSQKAGSRQHKSIATPIEE